MERRDVTTEILAAKRRQELSFTEIDLPPADPTISRFYEMLQLYGAGAQGADQRGLWRRIMSAVAFHLALERRESDAGPRVRITLDGKFLPYPGEGSASVLHNRAEPGR